MYSGEVPLPYVASRRRHLEMFIYYTDLHDVDEDIRTISNYGGRWLTETNAGVAYRDIRYDPTSAFDTVASLKNKNSLSQ